MAIPANDICSHCVKWAKQHDWFHSAEFVPGATIIQVWVKEGDKMHPYPFRNLVELRSWAGY